MKRKFTFLMAAVALLCFMLPPMTGWGQAQQVSNLTFTAACGGSGTADDGAEWTVTSDGTESNFDNIKGIHYGTGSAAVKYIELSTDNISGTITKVVVNASTASGVSATVSVTVGGNNFGGEPKTTSATATDYTFEGSDSGEIVVTHTKPSSATKALYVKSVIVTYTTGSGSGTYTVTYNKNGGEEVTGSVPTDANEYDDDNNTVTVAGNTGSLEKTGNDWSGWCLNADGTGTVYGPAYTTTYTISSNTTFYAKWMPRTHTVTLPANDTYGTYTMDASNPVAYGTNVALTYTPSTGYENYVATWSVNGTTISGNTFAMPDEDVAVTVVLNNFNIDQINFTFAATGTGSYANWSGKEGGSGAVYAGRTAGSSSNDYIQLNYNTSSTSGAYHSGIITTGSGGKVRKIEVIWATNGGTMPDTRKLTIYGKNTAYSETGELYDESTRGTELGSVVKNGVTSLDINDDYDYIGLLPDGAAYFKTIKIYWEPSTDPSITANNVDIEHGATGGNITYTINNPVEGASLTASVNEGATISNFALGTVGASPIAFTCDANTETTAKTATVTLNYVKNAETLATRTVTITQAAAPVIYSTIPALFEAATDTDTNVAITMNDWVISAVKNSNAYLTDNNGNGLIIYTSGHGFEVYDKLNGTITSTLVNYNGSTELKGLKATTDGLTVTKDGVVTPQVIAINSLSGVNTGALLTFSDLTYNGSALVDANNNTITPYTTLYSGSFTNGKAYDVVGVYLQHNNTKEILPRNAADIVLKADLSDTDFSGLTAFTYVLGSGPSTAQTVEVYCYDLGTNILTATAPANYEVSLTGDDDDYHASVAMTPDAGDVSENLYIRLIAGLTANDYNGKLTFTASNLTTVEVDLEGTVSTTQQYTITLNQPTVATIASDESLAEAGTTVTLSYTNLDDCYTFTGWTVLDGNADPVEVNNNQFTMPASNVEVEGNFTQKTFTVSYSVNGTIHDVLKETVSCGDNAPLYSASDLDGIVELPAGYTIAGWSTAESSTATVSSYAPEADATLYAVFAQSSSAEGYQLITSASQITEGKYLFAALRAESLPNPVEYSIATGVITSGDIVVTDAKYQPTNDVFATLPEGGVEFDLAGDNTNGFVISYNSQSLGYTAAQNRKLAFGNYNDYLWKFFDKEQGLSDGAIYMQIYKNYVYYTVSENSTNTSAIRGYASNTKYRGFYLFKKNETSYCTRIFQQEISSYGTSNGGYRLIASPVNTTPEAAGMITDDLGASATPETSTYDLYYFDQNEELEWRNYRANSFNLEPGKGYLYANKNDVTLNFGGTPYTGNGEITGLTEGWNLIGNPFGTAATVNKPNYRLTENGSALNTEAYTESTPVSAMEGLFVQATATGQTATFTQQTRGEKSNAIAQANLMVNQNGSIIDNAIVRFDGGQTLDKFQLRENSTRVYFTEDGHDYAIVNVEAQGELPVNFKAAENGTYTINVATENLNVDYLHLIDNLTGTDVDLLATPSYTFESRKNDYASRFRLRFSANNNNNNSVSDEFAFVSNGEIVIMNEGEATLQVIDMLGRTVSTQAVDGNARIDKMSANGVYVLRLIDGNEVKTQKIVIE